MTPLILVLSTLIGGSAHAGPTVDRDANRPDPHAGRVFRRLNPLRPVLDPACERLNDPRVECRTLREPRREGARPAGYYYGWFRGRDGKLRYGKMYLPGYGNAPGHNDPPARARPATPATPNPSPNRR